LGVLPKKRAMQKDAGARPPAWLAKLRCSTFGLMRGCTSCLLLSVTFRVLVELTLAVLRAELIVTALIIYFCCCRFLINLPSAYWVPGHFDAPPADSPAIAVPRACELTYEPRNCPPLRSAAANRRIAVCRYAASRELQTRALFSIGAPQVCRASRRRRFARV